MLTSLHGSVTVPLQLRCVTCPPLPPPRPVQGGYKAVVWADVLQASVMMCGVLAIIIQGCINVGGFSEMLEVNRKHGRLTMFT